MTRKQVALLIVAAIALTGCSGTLKVTKPDTTGYFQTPTKLDANAVKIAKPFDEKYRALLYVKMDDSKANLYTDFFVSSFTNMNIFTKVTKKSDLESMIIERKLTDKVSNVSDLIGLNNLQKLIGPFLVVEPYAEWKGGYNYIASLKAIDPETGETVLLIEQKAFNWAGLDKPLFFPLFNGFIDWTKGKQITLAQPAAK